MRFARRRILLAVSAMATMGAASTLVAGTTFGFYSSKPGSESNSFTSGTVTLASTVTGACTVTSMAPGDSPAACTFVTTYSGSLTAYLAVDVVIETQAGSGGTDLYNPGGSNGLTVTVADNQTAPVTYTVPTTSTTCPGSAPGGSTCYELDNELLGTSTYANGATDTISTSVALPTAAGNGYQGGAAQVLLTAHAVQSKNNALACTTTATAGHSCTPSGSFAWS
ncbi:MAG: TasA family protein [Acidimicrobiales bacterium]